MSPDGLQRGDTYFVVNYLDPKGFVAEIETHIYVGENLLDGDDEKGSWWYFQQATKYLSEGPFTGFNDNYYDRGVTRADAEALEMYCDIDELIEQLAELGDRIARKR